MTDEEFVEDMRSYSIDHEPDGYPCIQMHQIDRLIGIIDRLMPGEFICKKCGLRKDSQAVNCDF